MEDPGRERGGIVYITSGSCDGRKGKHGGMKGYPSGGARKDVRKADKDKERKKCYGRKDVCDREQYSRDPTKRG